MITRICVFLGSSFGSQAEYANAAAEFGIACARQGIGIVYGGASVGLMGVLADSALAAGGEVIGVMPRAMIREERAHQRLTTLISVDSMHERKQRMADLADAFVALPGGIGTLEEVAEMFTWLQLGLHLKPVGLLNTQGFYDLFVAFVANMCARDFLIPAHHALLTVEENIERLLDRMASAQHTRIPKPIYKERSGWISSQIAASAPSIIAKGLPRRHARGASTKDNGCSSKAAGD